MLLETAPSARRHATVALVVPHGFTARLFLRSSLLPELLVRVGHVGVFAPPSSLETLRQEFAGSGLSFYALHSEERRRDVAANFIRLLLADWRLTRTRQIREREEWLSKPWRRPLWPAHKRLASLAPLRRGWYAWENRLYRDPYHQGAFRTLRPDVVVTATPGVVTADLRLIRRARAESVPTVAFVQGWDNLTSKTIIGARPDALIVWNRHMRDEAAALHGFRPNQVRVTGAPHLDPYFTRDGWVGRDEYLRSIGLDPSKKLILYATSPRRYFAESLEMIELLASARESGRFGGDTQIVVRLHPQVLGGPDAEDLSRYDRFKGRVHLDLPRGRTGLAADYTPDGIRHLGQLLDASAVTVNVCSSFTIDACVLDRPVVNICFDGAPRPYLHSVRRHYDADHYGYVLQTGAVRLANSPAALVGEINRYLADPRLEWTNRARLVEELCYRADGRAGARVAAAIAAIDARRREGARGEPAPSDNGAVDRPPGTAGVSPASAGASETPAVPGRRTVLGRSGPRAR